MENLNNTVEQEPNDKDLKKIIEERFAQVRNQAMVTGFKVSNQRILDKINAFEKTPGSKSNNDHKRLIKDIKKFCEQALARKQAEAEAAAVAEDEESLSESEA